MSFFTFFFFNDTATPEIYTLSLHDALPISIRRTPNSAACPSRSMKFLAAPNGDRKSTRLNSSHRCISYAVFCLKKKNNQEGPHLHIGDRAPIDYEADHAARGTLPGRRGPGE